MNIRLVLATAAILAGGAFPVFAQSNATIAGTETAPSNSAGGPSAATTMGNLSTTTTSAGGAVTQMSGGGPLPAGTVNSSANSVAQTPGSPANSGR